MFLFATRFDDPLVSKKSKHLSSEAQFEVSNPFEFKHVVNLRGIKSTFVLWSGFFEIGLLISDFQLNFVFMILFLIFLWTCQRRNTDRKDLMDHFDDVGPSVVLCWAFLWNWFVDLDLKHSFDDCSRGTHDQFSLPVLRFRNSHKLSKVNSKQFRYLLLNFVPIHCFCFAWNCVQKEKVMISKQSMAFASPGMLQNGLSRELFEMWCGNKRNGLLSAFLALEYCQMNVLSVFETEK